MSHDDPDLIETTPYGEIEIVTTYGAPQAEYAAIRKAAGLMALPHRAMLEIAGKDRHSFLNNFLTNLTWSKETKQGMAPGTGVYAFLLNGKGRVVADMNVLETGDSVFLETDARLEPLLKSSLEKYVFTEKVGFVSHAGKQSELALHGPGALAVLQEAGAVLTELPLLGNRRLTLHGIDCLVFRDDPCGVPGYHLLFPTEAHGTLWTQLTAPYEAQTNKRTLRPVGWAMFNATRIEAGRPLFGIDFTDQSLPAETGTFARAVSVTKGCYLGQEVVARMYARQVVARSLVGIRMAIDALPTEGAQLFDAADNAVGQITSSTLSPVLGGAAIALAVVKKGFFDPGTLLKTPAEGALREAKVVPLPFIEAAVSATL